MVKVGEREKMLTSGLGNDPLRPLGSQPSGLGLSTKRITPNPSFEKGFTLVELLVVLLIMALGASLAALSLAPSGQQHLSQEATRLIAQLESAKAQARASSLSVSMGLSPNGFYFSGLSQNPLVQNTYPWLYPQTQGQLQSGPVLLGPEALTPPSSIVLTDEMDPKQHITIASDGLRPFQVISR